MSKTIRKPDFKRICDAHGFRSAWLARQIGIKSRNTPRKWYNGTSRINVTNAGKLERWLLDHGFIVFYLKS